jgi:dipeptidase E
MNKILLISSGLEAIKDFVGRPPETLRMVFIPTAGNPDKDVWWIDKDRDVLTRMGFRYSELDIANTPTEQLAESLDEVDLIYIAGGYTYYLLEQIRNTGFDTVLAKFMERGGLYVGASAGALIAGPDIEPCSSLDDPKYGPSLTSTKGIGLIDIVPMPHYDMSERSSAIEAIIAKYKDAYKVVPITDDEAIVSDGTDWHKVTSKRSKLEHAWFEKAH